MDEITRLAYEGLLEMDKKELAEFLAITAVCMSAMETRLQHLEKISGVRKDGTHDKIQHNPTDP